MKLRTFLQQPRLLRDVCAAFVAINKTCQFRFSPSGMKLVCIDVSSGIQAWYSAPAESMFEQYIVTSNEEGNEIIFDLNIDHLTKALRSCVQGASTGLEEIVLRLTKQDKVPYLELVFTQNTMDGSPSHMVQHKVPVRFLHVTDPSLMKEPVCPPPDVYISFPESLQPLIKICERYRYLNPLITIEANRAGVLKLSTSSSEERMVSVETTFSELSNVYVPTSSSSNDNDSPRVSQTQISQTLTSDDQKDDFYSVQVASKEWWNVLQIQSFAKLAILSVCHEKALILHCFMSDTGDERYGVLTYYMSHHST